MKRIKGHYRLTPRNSGEYIKNKFLGNNEFVVDLVNNNLDYTKQDLNSTTKFTLKINIIGFSITKEELDPSYSEILTKRTYYFFPLVSSRLNIKFIRNIFADKAKMNELSNYLVDLFNDMQNTKDYLKKLNHLDREKFLIENADWIEWAGLHDEFILYGLSEKFLEDYGDNFDWRFICVSLKINEKPLLDKLKKFINIYELVWYQKLPENFLLENIDKIDSDNLFGFQELSETFIRKNLHLINKKSHWDSISGKPNKLSHQFLVDFQDELNWDLLAQTYNFSEYSLRFFWDRLDWIKLKENYFIKYEIREKYQILKWGVENKRKRELKEIDSSSFFTWFYSTFRDIVYNFKNKKNGINNSTKQH